MQNTFVHHFCFVEIYSVLQKCEKSVNHMHPNSVCVFVRESDSRFVFQLPVLGVFSCRLCRARSVHFISCSFTDSVDPPLSCSASGSSLCQNKGECFTLLYTNRLMSSRQKLNILKDAKKKQ